MTRPAGGFVAWLELPKGVDAVALYRRALADGISIAPGSLFSAREKYRNFVRLNFAQGWSPRTVDAMKICATRPLNSRSLRRADCARTRQTELGALPNGARRKLPSEGR